MKRRIIALILVIVLLCSFLVSALAHDKEGHQKDMLLVLFGNQTVVVMGNPEHAKLADRLNDAVSIALDQFNTSKGDMLEELRAYGVPHLPKNITDLQEDGGLYFKAGGQTHRQFTHRGWTYSYNDAYKAANWPLRKSIMINTVKKVLNTDDDVLCESFAAVLYYIHILGDVTSERNERDQVIPFIEKHGINDIFIHKPNKDIFIELYHYLPILFQNRVSKTHHSIFNRMMSKIDKLYTEAKKDMKSNNADEKDKNDNNLVKDQLKKHSEQLTKILSENMPILLEHSVFDGIFYPKRH